jgi:hypothetical protein
LRQNEVGDVDFEEELRKLQDLDEDRVAKGHKGLTDEERARARLNRVKTRMSLLVSRNSPNDNTPKGGLLPNDQHTGFTS